MANERPEWNDTPAAVGKGETKQSNNSGQGRRKSKRKGNTRRQNKNQQAGSYGNSSSSNASGELRHIHGVDKEKGANDVNWYTHIYSVSEPLARVSFNIMTGSQYNPLNAAQVKPISGEGTWPVSADSTATVDPGIMEFRITPVMGDPEAANLAATQLYSLVRQANTGAKNYDKTDLMMMVMAMDNAYMLYEYLLRAFRVCKSWDYLNRYTPEALLIAMGFNSRIMTELANFEATLNLFAYRLSALCVPDQFDFIHRHSWLFSNIYEDENNGRAQMYIVNPSGFYVWTEGENDQPTYLHAVTINQLIPKEEGVPDGFIGTVRQVQQLIDSILTPLYGSEDVGLMNGDLIKAFGDGGMIRINPVDTSPLAPVHNDEVLEQLMNSDVLSDVTHPVVFSSIDITQDLSSLTAGPQLAQNLTYTAASGVAPRNAIKSLLNALDDVSSDRVITSTRLKYTVKYTPGQSGLGTEKIISCGTEFVQHVTMYYRNASGLLNAMSFIPRASTDESFTTTMMATASKFRYHPTIYLFSSSNNRWNYTGYFQDSAITAWLDDDWIDKMNEVAIMSEYAVKDFKTGLS